MTDNPTDMPEEIWAYQSEDGYDWKGKRCKIGHHGTGTWIDFDDSSPGHPGTKYHHDDVVKALELAYEVEHARSENQRKAIKQLREALEELDWHFANAGQHFYKSISSRTLEQTKEWDDEVGKV